MLHLTESLGRGGAERSLVDRVRFTATRGVAHHVVGLYADDALAAEMRSAGATVAMLGGRRPRHLPRLLSPLLTEIRRFRPDILHTQLLTADLAGRAASLLVGRTPIVSTLQNLPYDDRASRDELGSRAAARFLRLADRLSQHWTGSRLVAVSEEVRRSYSGALSVPVDRIAVIPNGVDTLLLRPRPDYAPVQKCRQALALPSSGRIIVALARLVPQKGLRHLLAALALPPLRALDATLLVAGDGPLRHELSSQARGLGIEQRVSFLGRLEQVVPLLEAADVFALPSIYEGLPLALLEAMALGVPAVASDLPELRDLASGRSLELVPAGDEPSLAQALARLLTDQAQARSTAARGVARVADAYDARANAARFLALVEADLQERRR